MTVPLWILAFFAAVAGVLALSNNHVLAGPTGSTRSSGPTSTTTTWAPAAVWALAIIDAVIAVVGVSVGLGLWMATAERPALEVAFLQRSWYINELYDAVLGRPLRAPGRLQRHGDRHHVIDGGVNGVATLVRNRDR